VGREYQAASNSQAGIGTLKGGTRRRRFHPLRALVATMAIVLGFQAAYASPLLAAASGQAEQSSPSVSEPAPSAAVTPEPTPAASEEAASATPIAGESVTPAPAPTVAPPTLAPSLDPTPAPGTIGLLPPLPAGATEVVSKRTDTSRTYQDASGKTVTELYTNPVYYQPEGKTSLEPIRLGYLRSADNKGAVSGKAPMKVTVEPATDAGGFLTVESAGYTIRYRPLTTKGLPASASTAAAIDGGAADLKDIIPGVDLRVLARSRTASVFFILDRASDATKLSFAIDAPGLTAVVNADGQIVFSDAAGTEIARMSHPWAMDSTPDTMGLGSGRMTGGVNVALTGTASPYTATVTVDSAWLKDAVYPVYVDPTLALADTSSSDDAFVNAGNTGMIYGEYCRPDSPYYCELWLGQSPSPTSDVGSVFMKWSMSSLMYRGIDTASLQFFPYHQYLHSTPKNTWVWQVSGSWSEATLKYSNRPGVTGSARTGDTAEDTWSDINIAPIVRLWTSGDATNYGVRIDENGNNYNFWKRVISVEQSGSYVHIPRIVYTSHTLGATPDAVASMGPSGALTWTYANGGSRSQTQFLVEVATDSAFTSIVASSGAVSQTVVPGGTGTWTVPALTDLTRYWWRVRVNDGTGWSARTAASIPFVYDAQQRGAEPWFTSVPFDLGGGWGLDVAVHTGEARLGRSLYTIPGVGPVQGLDLTYSSRNVAAAGQLGYGWTSNLTQTLWRNSTTSPTQVIWYRADGARVVFTGSGTTWTPTADHFETLTVSGTEWTVKESDQTRLVFSLPAGVATGNLARIEDRFGKSLTFNWGASSATVTSPSSQVTTLNYPGGSLITSVVDPAGRTWTLGYTGSDLTSITEPDPDGAGALAAPVTTIGYASHLATTVTRQRRTAVGGTDTLIWTVVYTSGKVTGVIDPIAHATYADVASTFTYNAGNTVAALLRTYSPAIRNSTTYAFDGVGRVTQSTDPNTFVTRFGWNSPSSMLAYLDVPLDASTWTRTAYAYDTAGNVLTETADALGDPSVTRYTYNASNDVLSTDVADGTADEVVTTSVYDSAGTGGTPGHTVKVTANSADADLSKRQVTEYAYNADHLVAAEWEHAASASVGRTTTHAYNANGVETTTIENCTNSGTTQLGDPAWKTCTAAGTRDAATNVQTSSVVSAGTTTGKLGLPDSVTTGVGLTDHLTSYGYDALGQTTSETDDAGTTTHEWDQLGNEIRTTAPGSLVTTLTLDLMNRATTEAAPLRTTTTQYDAAGSVTSTTTANDTVARTYDGAGQLLSETIDPGSTPHLALTTEHAYDAAGEEIATRDPDLTVTRTFYDAQGRVTKTVENCTSSGTTVWSAGDSGWTGCTGLGTQNGTWNLTTTFTYDDRGNKLSEVAPNGRVTTSTYDDLDRLTMQVDNDVVTPTLPTDDVTTEYAYDAAGFQAAAKSPTATGGASGYRITRSFFDALGRVTRVIENCTESGTTPPADPAWKSCTGAGTHDAATNIETSYTYDADGHRLSVTAPSPSATSGTDATIVTTRYAYDDAGRLCRVLENAGVDIQSLVDPCTTAVSGTNTVNVSTRYTYDTRGNLASMIDGRGNTTAYGYDDRGRMTSIDQPDVAANLVWAYNDAARTKTQTNRSTGSVVLTSDAAGRLVSRAYQDATGAARTTSYTYTGQAQAWTATDAAGTISVTNDRLGRPTQVTVSGDAGATTTYGYSFTAPTRTDASGSYTMTVDKAGRITSIDDPVHAANWTFGYGATGALAATGWPTTTALTTTSGYDPLGRLTSRTTTPGPRASYTETYNRAGHRLTEASTTTGDPANGTATTGYDPLGRLTSYDLPGIRSLGSTFDAVPNRTSLTANGNSVSTIFDAANRPTSSGYAYDADGRMTTRTGAAGTTLSYDSLGRLAEVRQNPGNTLVARYTYDGLDRLLKVERATGIIRFRYQGTSTAVAGIVDDGSGTTIRNLTVGPEGTVLQDWLATDQRLYGTNGHHDTTLATDAAGTINSTLRYDPWGNVLATTGLLPDWRFQGSYEDTATGLLWSIARWYDPVQGTFTSEDSLLGDEQSPASRHLFAYAEGDPIGGWDPSGTVHLTLKPTKLLWTNGWGDGYAGPASSPGWRVESRSSTVWGRVTGSWTLKATSGYVDARGPYSHFSVYLNGWLDEGGNLDAGFSGNAMIIGKIRVLIIRKPYFDTATKVVDWTPLYDFEGCVVGGSKGGVCPGDYPNRSRSIQWHTNDGPKIIAGDRLKAQVVMSVYTSAENGPWAEADGFLQLTKLGIDIDSY
jgi:RHS repeat-associated protein